MFNSDLLGASNFCAPRVLHGVVRFALQRAWCRAHRLFVSALCSELRRTPARCRRPTGRLGGLLQQAHAKAPNTCARTRLRGAGRHQRGTGQTPSWTTLAHRDLCSDRPDIGQPYWTDRRGSDFRTTRNLANALNIGPRRSNKPIPGRESMLRNFLVLSLRKSQRGGVVRRPVFDRCFAFVARPIDRLTARPSDRPPERPTARSASRPGVRPTARPSDHPPSSSDPCPPCVAGVRIPRGIPAGAGAARC